MRVLAFTGMPGSGKSEAVDEARRLGLPIVSMGDEIRATVRGLHLLPTDENLGRIATQYRAEKGVDWWARRTVERIEITHPKEKLVVIDGVRTRAEVENFRQRLGPRFHLVAIDAPIELRAERLRKRKREDDGLTIADLKRRDDREIGWGIKEAIESADIVVRNHGDLESFKAEIDAVLKGFKASA